MTKAARLLLTALLGSTAALGAPAAMAQPRVAANTVNAPVTLTDNGDSWTLDNGIVKMRVLKANSNIAISGLTYHGVDILPGRSEFWETTPSGTVTARVTIDPSTNGGEWKIGGGSYWAWGSYDPKRKLIYWSTGNPGHWSPSYRCGAKTHEECNNGKWDNKWSMTIFARHVETGAVAWAYQMTPFDQWDYDGVNENILVDNLDVDGKKQDVLVHFDRNGFNYVLNRDDGTLLRANKFVTVNWAEKVDLKTGRPIKVYEHSPFERHRNVQACPSAMGGKDQQPCSVDPKEPNKFYCPTNNWCMEDEPQDRTHTQQGTVYVFANVYMYPEKPGVTGKIKKFDILTGKTDWEIPDPYPNWSGTLNTDGGLMFYGSNSGHFRAVDRKTGKVLWERKLASGIIGNPITYKVGGKQYVSVFQGLGGWIGIPVTAGLDMNDKFGAIGATAMAKASGLDKIPQGGVLSTFRVYP